MNPNILGNMLRNNSFEVDVTRKETLREDSMGITYTNKEIEEDPVTIVMYLRTQGIKEDVVYPGIKRFKCILIPLEVDGGSTLF